MIRFILRRVLETIPVLFIIATVTFFMLRLAPGGPFDTEKATTPQIRKELEAAYGLDKPLPVQYFNYLKQLLHGNLGPSFKYPNRSVNELIADSFPVSFELGCLSLAIAIVLGLTAGLIAAMRANSVFDYSAMSFAMVGICLPTFVLGPLLVLVFAIHLHWFNASGWDFARDRVLPALTLGLYFAAYIARLTRGGMLEVLNQEFIRTARAKGASTARILFKHALRSGIAPVVSFLGPAAAGIITGSFVVET
ncbi:MAG TPA: ABC transporter permease subunit, partial [Verrucomicrobiae bacterium]|nr:ABC transporter permease subunit [Verrucomicrobiae bacterium]